MANSFKMKKRPYILSIAGFDPSGGAGLIADCKTFEAVKCQGLSVCTANTIQTDTDFFECIWTSTEVIKKQIEVLFERFDINVVKIGIIQNWETLLQIVNFLVSLKAEVKIVLDPVLRSSTNFDFQNGFDEEIFNSILEKIYVLTPNYNEIQALFPAKEIDETIKMISAKTNLFLKGGHNEAEKGKDYLYTKKGMLHPMNPKYTNVFPKHGSGCVLSSAIAANLASGFPLLKSCFRAKRFTEKYLGSSKELLGKFNF